MSVVGVVRRRLTLHRWTKPALFVRRVLVLLVMGVAMCERLPGPSSRDEKSGTDRKHVREALSSHRRNVTSALAERQLSR